MYCYSKCSFKPSRKRSFKENAVFTGGRNRINNSSKHELNCFFCPVHCIYWIPLINILLSCCDKIVRNSCSVCLLVGNSLFLFSNGMTLKTYKVSHWQNIKDKDFETQSLLDRCHSVWFVFFISSSPYNCCCIPQDSITHTQRCITESQEVLG